MIGCQFVSLPRDCNENRAFFFFGVIILPLLVLDFDFSSPPPVRTGWRVNTLVFFPQQRKSELVNWTTFFAPCFSNEREGNMIFSQSKKKTTNLLSVGVLYTHTPKSLVGIWQANNDRQRRKKRYEKFVHGEPLRFLPIVLVSQKLVHRCSSSSFVMLCNSSLP